MGSGGPKRPLPASVDVKGKGDKPAAPHSAARTERSAAEAGVALTTGAEDDSLDTMMERLKDLHRKLKTGTAERTDAAELERLKRRYEAAAGGALRSKAEARMETRDRIVEMKGKIETATRRQVTVILVLPLP